MKERLECSLNNAAKLSFVLTVTVIFLLVCGFSAASAQTVAKLPVPANGYYQQTFAYPIARVVPADLNGDGNLDFVSKSQHVNGSVRIEARLYNSSSTLWEFDTFTSESNLSNPLDLALIAWDFNDDGIWEIYFHYRNNGQWHHRIVNGSNGSTLAQAQFPAYWPNNKVMAAIAYRSGKPRIVVNIDYWENAGIWMFEAWNGSNWSLNTMSGWPYEANRGVAHDMIRTADVDLNGSDDEILAGAVVLNADGSVRYHLKNIVPNGQCGNSDQALLGFFDPAHPNDLIYVVGDGDGKNVTAVWAETGELIWHHHMGTLFSSWTHFHSGWLSNKSSGAELLVVDRDTEAWAYISVKDGAIINSGTTEAGRPSCSGTKPIKWDEDEYDDCGVNQNNALDGRIDLGGGGCEEVWGLNGANTLYIAFNTNCSSGFASRWENRHYRQDGVMSASGYAPYWLGALVLSGSCTDTTPPTISSVATSNITGCSATITWTTNEASDSKVEYGLTTAYGSSLSNASLVASHSLELPGLAANTIYHYRVRSKDVCGNETVSGDHTFTTTSGGGGSSGNQALSAQASASGETPAYGQTASKAIDNVVDGYPGDYTKEWASGQSSGVWLQLNWSSSVTLSSVVLYDRPNTNDHIQGGQLSFSSGANVNVGALNNNGIATTVTFSSRIVTWVRFTVTSSVGNSLGLAELQAFGPACDTTPPTISNVAAGNITSTGATITWTTNESSDSQVEYGTTTSYGSTTSLDATLVTSHSVNMSGLNANTLYHYRVKSKDAAGNLANSADQTFTTSGSESNVALIAQASASGETPAYGQTASKAIDNVVDGYPGDYTKEWASGQSSGVWLQLNWSSSVTINRVVLHDRPNTNDHIQGGQLSFSSGANVNLGALNNNGTATTVTFSSRTVTWVRFTVTGSAGSSLGLAEMQVWGTSSAPKNAESNEDGPAASVPQTFSLSEIYPNPFNPTASFKLNLADRGHVSAIVYNINGEEITRVYEGKMPAGYQSLQWDGRNQLQEAVSSGVYLLRVEYIGATGLREVAMRRMVLLK